MSVTRAVFRDSVFFLAAIPLFAIWGFWVTYFARPAGSVVLLEHIHGIAMFAWCFLLIAQSGLIRAGRRSMHRQFGKLSYLLVPVIVVSTVSLANYQLNQRALSIEGQYIFSLQVFILLQFLFCYLQGIRHRRTADVHARYMICTALPLLDPIFARILGIHFLQVDLTSGIVQYITYGATDLILLALAMWDWRAHRRRDVFAPVLAVFIATQLPTFVLVGGDAWQAFAAWFAGLPLS
jgi:hypothetical protein